MLAEQQKLSSGYTSKVSQVLLAAMSDKSKPIEVKRRALEAVAPLGFPEVEKAIGEAELRFRVTVASESISWGFEHPETDRVPRQHRNGNF